MPLDKFKKIIPKAYPAGQTVVGGYKVDAYELVWRHTEYMMGDRTSERLWFYFSDKKLVKWGRPGDWPTPADFTVEWRDR